MNMLAAEVKERQILLSETLFDWKISGNYQ